ncbi:hypothetical protein [Desulfoferula mesophila]|uniref:Curlin associated repeat-containing protein n=1 Tax=Desulfoferula mesophila TaxID=3058419 RepID=A0AAU9EFR3_9BACT|nr:hypothetical protein FAK_30740 [Desulfoferula mesophilus]
MKKILLGLLGVCLLSSVAMAGGIDIVNQPYDFRNQSYITQSGDFSWAMVNQYGDQSVSTISQTGTFDKAYVSQSSNCCFKVVKSWGGHHNWFNNYKLVALFTGDFWQNASYISQSGRGFHDAYVNQNGDGNWSVVVQKGKKDGAHVTQNGNFNLSQIKQDGWGVNNALVDQSGDGNVSFIDQTGGGVNLAMVDQHGYGNFSDINQGGNKFSLYGGFHCPINGGSGINTAVVNQLGYMNYSEITQTGRGTHTAFVNQANFCYTASLPGCPGGRCN